MDLCDDERSDPKSPRVIARTRWKLLAKALQQRCRETSPVKSQIVPTTSRELYGLFQWQLSDSNRFWKDTQGHWLQCCSFIHPHFSLNLRFLSSQFSISELTGFNNTGNICVWPSEEVLAYYCMKHSDIFKQKTVLELGGGMTCLASLVVAKTSEPILVTCTDGNQASIENVKRIIQHNNFNSTCPVTAQLLDWKSESAYGDMESVWDVVLCADCVFFDDGREDLVDAMQRLTTNNGLILITAPRRGRTLDAFLALCHGKFEVYLEEDFDVDVTLSHQKKLLSASYNPDHNYPLLVRLKKL